MFLFSDSQIVDQKMVGAAVLQTVGVTVRMQDGGH